jgi:hypothetical protein
MEPQVIAPVFVRVIAPEFMRVVDPPFTRVVVPPFMRVLRELTRVKEPPPWRVLEVVLVPHVAPDIVLTPPEVVVDVRVVELVVPFRAAVTACSAPLSVAPPEAPTVVDPLRDPLVVPVPLADVDPLVVVVVVPCVRKSPFRPDWRAAVISLPDEKPTLCAIEIQD